jgi:hypothetical protein
MEKKGLLGWFVHFDLVKHMGQFPSCPYSHTKPSTWASVGSLNLNPHHHSGQPRFGSSGSPKLMKKGFLGWVGRSDLVRHMVQFEGSLSQLGAMGLSLFSNSSDSRRWNHSVSVEVRPHEIKGEED